jgi:hypothetical protein
MLNGPTRPPPRACGIPSCAAVPLLRRVLERGGSAGLAEVCKGRRQVGLRERCCWLPIALVSA